MKDDMKPRFGNPISEWYRYFCWRPISTNDRGWRWLSLVWKRKCQPYDFLCDHRNELEAQLTQVAQPQKREEEHDPSI